MSELKMGTVQEQLRDDYEAVNLEQVFRKNSRLGQGLSRWRLRRGIRQIVESTRNVIHVPDGPEDSQNRLANLDGSLKPAYQEAADRVFEEYIEDCLRYDILRKTQQGRYELVMADPTVFESERNGISIECQWAEPYTVYRHRMNTSGRIDIEANGDPAIDGISVQDPLAW